MANSLTVTKKAINRRLKGNKITEDDPKGRFNPYTMGDKKTPLSPQEVQKRFPNAIGSSWAKNKKVTDQLQRGKTPNAAKQPSTRAVPPAVLRRLQKKLSKGK